MQTFRYQLTNNLFSFLLNVFPFKHRNEIFVQFHSRIFVLAPMEAKTAILTCNLTLHVEPHIYIIALTNYLCNAFSPDFHLQLICQFCLNAAFCNAPIICPYEGVLFRERIDRERRRLNTAVWIPKQPTSLYYSQFSAMDSLFQFCNDFSFVMTPDVLRHGLDFGKHDSFRRFYLGWERSILIHNYHGEFLSSCFLQHFNFRTVCVFLHMLHLDMNYHRNSYEDYSISNISSQSLHVHLKKFYPMFASVIFIALYRHAWSHYTRALMPELQ